MDARYLVAVLLAIMLIGALPAWPYSTGWGYYPSSGFGLILIVILIFAIARRA